MASLRVRTAAGGLGLAVALLAALVVPAGAQASAPHALGVSFFDAGDVLGKVVAWLFPKVDDTLRNVGEWMVSLPEYGTDAAYADLQRRQAEATAIAWGLLGLVLSIAAVRYWASGFTSGGSFTALTAVKRSVIAGAALIVFPYGFGQVQHLLNLVSGAFMTTVGSSVDSMFTTYLTAGAPTGLIGILILVMVFLLLFVKVILAGFLAIMYVVTPLALALWPLEEVAWLARSALQATLGIMLWPVVWAVGFGVSGAVAGAVTGSAPPPLKPVIDPLTTLAALYLSFKLPITLLRQSGLGSATPSVGRGMLASLVVWRSFRGWGAGGAGPAAPRPQAPGHRPYPATGPTLQGIYQQQGQPFTYAKALDPETAQQEARDGGQVFRVGDQQYAWRTYDPVANARAEHRGPGGAQEPVRPVTSRPGEWVPEHNRPTGPLHYRWHDGAPAGPRPAPPKPAPRPSSPPRDSS